MTKHSVRDGAALAASIRAHRGHDTHGNLYARPIARPIWRPGYLPTKFHDGLAGADYTIISYGTPIAWRAPLSALDALSEAGAYRDKGTLPSKYGGDYVAYRVPGEDAVWVVPEVRYSSTTNRHQSTVRQALHELGAEVVRYINGK